jgi:hypothetical protein
MLEFCACAPMSRPLLLAVSVLLGACGTAALKPSDLMPLIKEGSSPSSLLSKCQRPDTDYSSENEKPRPIFLTRQLTYQGPRLRIIYVGTSLPQDFPGAVSIVDNKWKLLGFTDPVGERKLSQDEAAARLVSVCR